MKRPLPEVGPSTSRSTAWIGTCLSSDTPLAPQLPPLREEEPSADSS